MAALGWGIRRWIESVAIFTPVSQTETDANVSPSQGTRLNWFHSLSLSKFHLESVFQPGIIPPGRSWGPAGDYWLSKCTVRIFVTASTFFPLSFQKQEHPLSGLECDFDTDEKRVPDTNTRPWLLPGFLQVNVLSTDHVRMKTTTFSVCLVGWKFGSILATISLCGAYFWYYFFAFLFQRYILYCKTFSSLGA